MLTLSSKQRWPREDMGGTPNQVVGSGKDSQRKMMSKLRPLRQARVKVSVCGEAVGGNIQAKEKSICKILEAKVPRYFRGTASSVAGPQTERESNGER